MSKVVLIDAVRTPYGKMGGALSRLDSADLASALLKAMAQRNLVDLERIGHIVFGQSHPSTSPNNMGHYASLLARYPESIPGYTVHSNCASGLQAFRSAYYMIASGAEDICIAGGTDSYSFAPFAIRNARVSFPESSRVITDTIDEAEKFTQPKPISRAERYESVYGDRSEKALVYQKASLEAARGAQMSRWIVPVSYTDRKKGEIVISADELLQSDALPTLPEYADGAAAAMLMTQEMTEELGLVPLAEVMGFGVAGSNPLKRRTPGADAALKLLKRKGVSAGELALVEIMENSAEEVLDTIDALGVSGDVVNTAGGSLSFGRNEGAEGISMIIRLVEKLKGGEMGLACINSAGGQGMAVLLRRL